MDRLQRDKLKWKCRRGLLELDLVLERFLQRCGSFEEGELASLQALLDLPDNELWDVVSGRSDDFDPRLGEMVARLRAC
jgi:antitoxin CptB